MTEQEAFVARFGEMRAGGLVDIKFCLNPSIVGVTPERIFADLNRIETADGVVRHATWDEVLVVKDMGDLLC